VITFRRMKKNKLQPIENGEPATCSLCDDLVGIVEWVYQDDEIYCSRCFDGWAREKHLTTDPK